MEEFDVVVAGGGPAGVTVATLVAMRGHRVLLLDREVFPRYRIGEALAPSTVHEVGRLLGVTDQLAKAEFRVRRGGAFHWGAGAEPWTYAFADSPRLAGPESYGYQVERARFDEILLTNAKDRGVEVREGCPATGVVTSGPRVTGLRYADADGGEHEVRARYVVDASGGDSTLHAAVGETRVPAEAVRTVSLSGYFGLCRQPAPYDGNTLVVAFDSGWFWYTPLTGGLSSVGAVVRAELAAKVEGDREQAFAALIAECPLIAELLTDAARVTAGQKYGRLRVTENRTYHRTAFWRPGMVLVGDAACAVDPVFASGVHLATYSGLLAARALTGILAGDRDETTALTAFATAYHHEYRIYADFLAAFHATRGDGEACRRLAATAAGGGRTPEEAFADLAGGLPSRPA
ncbi:tryptophan 7-halogenase [Actinoplanes rectilineatus]|uniref:tryptophan 7-halogenase n=1 Tax=Actinoplanes rectilineatus TaxID=113571 RepID=UPI0009F94DE8|nr:tryptophan 7-halogenase [Actinoplanes rectilineatus]